MKNTAPAREVERCMIPAAKKSLLYFSMALVSGPMKEKILPLGVLVHRSRSVELEW